MKKKKDFLLIFQGKTNFSETFSVIFFFAKTNFPQSFCGGKKKFEKFCLSQFGCKMKFGQNFVFPDPASRVSQEPLKYV